MSSQDTSFAKDFLAETLVIGSGVTAVINPVAGQLAVQIRYGTGGSLSLLGSTYSVNGVVQGSTFATAQNYLFGNPDSLAINCTGAFTLYATGATVTAYIIRGLSTPKANL